MPHRLEDLIAAVAAGAIVPYLGPGALFDVADSADGAPMPADSDSLILAMNRGQPMAPKLMYEFPRAAMNLELKKGRSAVTRFLNELYGRPSWSEGAVHRWLAKIAPPYVIDCNRDGLLQRLYADRPHILIQGVSRIGGTDFRFKIFQRDGDDYREVSQETADTTLPILFKPLGCATPEPNYVASDADFVDYITELMGGFAIPSFVKAARVDRQYLFLGLPMTRDTERMVLSDMIYSAGDPAGYALIETPTEKEERFCERQRIKIIRTSMPAFAEALATGSREAALPARTA